MTKNDAEIRLRRCRLLRGMSNEAVKIVFKKGTALRFDQGDFIIHEKQYPPGLAIILEGKVEVFLSEIVDGDSTMRSTRFRLAFLCPGECIGEYSLIDKNPASASVVATEPCLIFVIARNSFERLISERDDIAKIIYRNMLNLVVHKARSCVEDLDRYRLLTV